MAGATMSDWDDHGYGGGMSAGIHNRWCVCEKCCPPAKKEKKMKSMLSLKENVGISYEEGKVKVIADGKVTVDLPLDDFLKAIGVGAGKAKAYAKKVGGQVKEFVKKQHAAKK